MKPTTFVARGDGTVEHLLACERAAGMDRCVVLCAATTPAQVIPANNYARELQRTHPEIIAFGTLHPAYARWEEELHSMERGGLRGIKLHPDFQGFRLDDPRLLPMFEAAQGRFLFELHIGSAQPASSAPSSPQQLAAIARAFPGLTLIAGHFGGYLMWDMAIEALAGLDNVWFDTSSTSPFVTPHLLRRLLDAHPLERFLFGSDWPPLRPRRRTTTPPTRRRPLRQRPRTHPHQRRTTARPALMPAVSMCFFFVEGGRKGIC